MSSMSAEWVSGNAAAAEGEMHAWLRGDDLPREQRGDRPKWGEYRVEEFTAEKYGMPAFGRRVVLVALEENPFWLQVRELEQLLEFPRIVANGYQTTELRRQLGFARNNLAHGGTSPERRASHQRTAASIAQARAWLQAAFRGPMAEPGEQGGTDAD